MSYLAQILAGPFGLVHAHETVSLVVGCVVAVPIGYRVTR